VIGIFVNSCSFVEMPLSVVRNYIDKCYGFHEAMNAAIALMTYESFDLNTTFHRSKLPECFEGREFDYFEAEQLLDASRQNLYFVSPDKCSVR
jgi:hypothetical protein